MLTLSPAQQRVVDLRGSDLQVVACAGAGKTEAISRRIAALVAEGAELDSIVAFTFTERAAGELKNRVAQRVVEPVGPGVLDQLGQMYVGTIHGYCFRILQDHVPHYGNYDVLDEHRHAGLLSREFWALNAWPACGPCCTPASRRRRSPCASCCCGSARTGAATR